MHHIGLVFLLTGCKSRGDAPPVAETSESGTGGSVTSGSPTLPATEDADGDGFAPDDGDCDEGNAALNPLATDVVGDGVDQNCDGVDGFDGDGDDVAADWSGGTDCADDDPAVHPGVPEVPHDGVDQDCDGADQEWLALDLWNSLSVALDVSGEVWGWGQYASRAFPFPAGPWVGVRTDGNSACAIDADGVVTCSGTIVDLGHVPRAVPFSGFDIWGGGGCGVLRDSGELECWGVDQNGLVSLAPQGSWSGIEMNPANACAVSSTGAGTCWGYDGYGEVSQYPDSNTFHTIVPGGGFVCGLELGGSVTCWGNEDNPVLTETPVGSGFVDLACGSSMCCAVDVLGLATCWGSAANGGATTPATPFVEMAVGDAHACGLTAEGLIECWGDNSFFQSDVPR